MTEIIIVKWDIFPKNWCFFPRGCIAVFISVTTASDAFLASVTYNDASDKNYQQALPAGSGNGVNMQFFADVHEPLLFTCIFLTSSLVFMLVTHFDLFMQSAKAKPEAETESKH